MTARYGFGRKRRCPHAVKYGMYGDMVNAVGGWRLFCPACNRFLDGPVSLSDAPFDAGTINLLKAV